jgi:hypothetical protein
MPCCRTRIEDEAHDGPAYDVELTLGRLPGQLVAQELEQPPDVGATERPGVAHPEVPSQIRAPTPASTKMLRLL